MRSVLITCDALVEGPNDWARCGASTMPPRLTGWMLDRRGDFCRRHAPIATAMRALGWL